jgi:type I restriction enzyme S subunit
LTFLGSNLYYLLCDISESIKSIASGAATPIVNKSLFSSVNINVPSLDIQNKIAAILSAYDDLIENNLRRIKILEEMAQALYREWFVHYRFPGHEKVRLVDSPLGKIPEGWRVEKLGNIIELNYGKGLPKEKRREGCVPVYGSSGIVGYHDRSIVDGPGIIVGRKGNVGSVFWSDTDFYPIDTVYYVSSELPLRYLFYDLQTRNFINNDAAVPGLNRKQAYSLETILPTPELMDKFCNITEAFGKQASILRNKNEILRRTRDLLLPKLISGEIDVSELDIKVPEELD